MRFSPPFILSILSLLLLASPITARPTTPGFLPHCGIVTYDPNVYTCSSASPLLCPIVHGQRYQSCNASCFDPHMYRYGRPSFSSIH